MEDELTALSSRCLVRANPVVRCLERILPSIIFPEVTMELLSLAAVIAPEAMCSARMEWERMTLVVKELV